MKNKLLMMSFLSLLLGCNRKENKKSKTKPWPRFPATDNPKVKIEPVVLDHDFELLAFFLMPDKQSVYVLASRSSGRGKTEEGGEPLSESSYYRDFRLYCLDDKGKVKKQLDIPRTNWRASGSLGLLEGQLLARVEDWFLVLDTTKWVIQEKIPVHEAYYVAWKATTMTHDEHEADHQKKFEVASKNPNAKLLHWVAGGEDFVFMQGAPGRRSAWSAMHLDEAQLDDLKKRCKPISVSINPTFVNPAHAIFADGTATIQEVEVFSNGTQLVYPNYKERSVVQYKLVLGNQEAHFSTTDRDGHGLRLGYFDNLLMTMGDGSVWVQYEGVIYRAMLV